MRPLLVAPFAVLTFAASAGAQPVADHLKCFKVKESQPKTSYTADLSGLVMETGCTIKFPAAMACVPTTKENVQPTPPGGGGTGTPNAFGCYKIKCPKGSLPPLQLNDQFGSRSVAPIKSKLLCAPMVSTTSTTVQPTAVTLSVTKNGAPSAVMMGTVDADTGPVDCGATCSGSYLYGDGITLTETHPASHYFLGWGGDCLPAGTTSTCTLMLNGDRSVTARFEHPVTVTLTETSPASSGAYTWNPDPLGGSCGNDCTRDFPSNTMVTLTATPDPGSVFVTWGQGACGTAGTNPVCIISLGTANVSVEATLAQQ